MSDKTISNIDVDYMKNYSKLPAAQQYPSFVNWKAENQYIWVYTRTGFERGLYYGAFFGTFSAVYHRRMMHIPAYALAFGTAYAAFHASSAYFRNEI